VKFGVNHDIKIGIPPNWIGERQVRIGEMWEEEENGSRRLYMTLGTEWSAVREGKEYKVEVGCRKRS
jgi:hypothetical protein